MQLRRKTFNECKGNPRLQKALALALYLKKRLSRSSMMRDYTINKLHKKSGVSPSTLRKYLPILINNGWAHFMGRHSQHLVISKLSSHTENRNISVDEFSFASFKDTYNSLRAFIALAIQHRKDFIRRTIQTCKNPDSRKEFIKARKTLKRLVKTGVLKGVDAAYKELGLSYRRIAQETGNCVRTAQRIIGYATNKGWCRKHRHYEVYQLRGISFRDVGEFFTFSTRDNIFQMQANTYTLGDRISSSLGMVSY